MRIRVVAPALAALTAVLAAGCSSDDAANTDKPAATTPQSLPTGPVALSKSAIGTLRLPASEEQVRALLVPLLGEPRVSEREYCRTRDGGKTGYLSKDREFGWGLNADGVPSLNLIATGDGQVDEWFLNEKVVNGHPFTLPYGLSIGSPTAQLRARDAAPTPIGERGGTQFVVSQGITWFIPAKPAGGSTTDPANAIQGATSNTSPDVPPSLCGQ